MTPVEMNEPSLVPTKIILPTVTNTNPPPLTSQPATKTPAIPPAPTEDLIKSESNLDFNKYGPIAFIDDLNCAIRLIHPDGYVNEWSYTNKDLIMNDISWSSKGEYIAISTTGSGIYILNVPDQKLNKLNLNSSQWNFEIIQYA
ncbi:MAG: hypothetical protein IH585_15685, partial [Anaerolineaceae bacterium]|nr:hypothetical protein [Anaerolineaceae bacterium]